MRKALLGLIGGPAVCLCLLAQSAEKKLPDGPGKPLTQRICTACHEIDTVITQRHDRPGWEKIVDDMVSRGADGTGEELKTVTDYLVKYFGPKSENSQ